MKGVSLTAAMFVFQACYGSMRDYYDVQVTFRVVAEDTGLPIDGVDIMYCDAAEDTSFNEFQLSSGITDEEGMATVWATEGRKHFFFVDKDSLYSTDAFVDPVGGDTIDIILQRRV